MNGSGRQISNRRFVGPRNEIYGPRCCGDSMSSENVGITFLLVQRFSPTYRFSIVLFHFATCLVLFKRVVSNLGH